MKLTDFIIVFVLITFPIILFRQIEIKNNGYMIEQKIMMDRILDTAITDGTNGLISHIDGNEMTLNYDRSIKNFYNTLFINLGIINSDMEKRRVMGYIPVILISDYDGFVVISKEEYTNLQGEIVIGDVVHEKMYYQYMKDDYIYLFTIEKQLKVINCNTNQIYEGDRKTLAPLIGTELLINEDLFEATKKRVINQKIQSEINYYISKHNQIKNKFGITYEFYSEVNENSNWCDTFDQIGLIAIFQGMPFHGINQYYNNVSVGSTKLVKNKRYFIQEDPVNHLYYYHREDCSHLIHKDYMVNSPREAAEKGAHPCPYCKP